MKLYPVWIARLSLVLAVAIPATSASAQLTAASYPCTSGSALTLMNPDALACSGAWNGNNSGNATTLAAVLAQIQLDFFSYVGAGQWSSLGTTDAGSSSGPFSNLSGANSGTLTFDNPITGFFVVALKASNQFSLYLFNGGTAGLSSVAFTTIGTSVNSGNGKKSKGNSITAQGLSHASLYDFNVPTTTTPEPGTLVLMITGFAVAGALARRRRA